MQLTESPTPERNPVVGWQIDTAYDGVRFTATWSAPSPRGTGPAKRTPPLHAHPGTAPRRPVHRGDTSDPRERRTSHNDRQSKSTMTVSAAPSRLTKPAMKPNPQLNCMQGSATKNHNPVRMSVRNIRPMASTIIARR